MRGLDRKTFFILFLLGLIVFSLRGTGDTFRSWQAVIVLYVIIALIVLVKWLVERRQSKRATETPPSKPLDGNPPNGRDSG